MIENQQDNIHTYRTLMRGNEVFGVSVGYFMVMLLLSTIIVIVSLILGYIVYGIAIAIVISIALYVGYQFDPRFFKILIFNLKLTPNMYATKSYGRIAYEEGDVVKDYLDLKLKRIIVNENAKKKSK